MKPPPSESSRVGPGPRAAVLALESVRCPCGRCGGFGQRRCKDQSSCDRARGVLVELSSFQIGWTAGNRKSLEPSNIAPTWIHMDVRNYAPEYLADAHFVMPEAGIAEL